VRIFGRGYLGEDIYVRIFRWGSLGENFSPERFWQT